MDQYKKRILVTGGHGFIGSNFLNLVSPVSTFAFFVNVDCNTEVANPDNVKQVVRDQGNYAYEKVDITDKEAVDRVFKKYDITDVIHFAAETHVDKSNENPDLFIKTNVVGTYNLLDAFRATKYARNRTGVFLFISTDEVYGSTDSMSEAWTEESIIDPTNIYSTTKASADFFVRAYCKTFGIDFNITRCCNNYGENQDNTKFIPKMIMKALANEPLHIYGDGKNFRQWINVVDHVLAVWTVFLMGKRGEVYNVGDERVMTNNELAREIIRLTGSSSEIKHIDDRPEHDKGYFINWEKLTEHTGWKPSILFSEGLSSYIEYVKKTTQK